MEKKPNLSSEKYQIPVNYEGDNLRRTVSDESVEHQKWGNGGEKDAKDTRVLGKKFGETARVDHVRPETDREYTERLEKQGVEDGLSKDEAATVAQKTVAMENEMFERTSGARGRREQIVALRKGMEADLAENDAALDAGTLTQMEHDQKAKRIQEDAENRIKLLEKAKDRQKEKYVADAYANADSSELHNEANVIASAEDTAAYERWAAKQDEEKKKLDWVAGQHPESASKSKLDRVEASAMRHAERIAKTKTEAEIAASEEAILNNLERHYHHQHDINANNIAQPTSTEDGRHLSHEDLERESERVKERATRQREQIEQYFANQEEKKDDVLEREPSVDAEVSKMPEKPEAVKTERSEAEKQRNMLEEAKRELAARKALENKKPESAERSEAEKRAGMLEESKRELAARKALESKEAAESALDEASDDSSETETTVATAAEKAESKASKSEAFLKKIGLLKEGIRSFGNKLWDEDKEGNREEIDALAKDFDFIERAEQGEETSTKDIYKKAEKGTLDRLKSSFDFMIQSLIDKKNNIARGVLEGAERNVDEESALDEKREDFATELALVEKELKRRETGEIVDATVEHVDQMNKENAKEELDEAAAAFSKAGNEHIEAFVKYRKGEITKEEYEKVEKETAKIRAGLVDKLDAVDEETRKELLDEYVNLWTTLQFSLQLSQNGEL